MESQLAGVNKDVTQQQQLLNKMLVLKPQSSSTLMQLAVLNMQQQNHLEADQYLLKINDSEDAGWPLLAQYQRAKWRVVAKQESDLAIELLLNYQISLPEVKSEMGLPPEAAVLWRMALAYENKQNNTKAIELLKASLKADKNFKAAEDDLERMTD